jgi:DedD protein
MAFFKFRQAGDSPTPSTRPAESVETLRQRARNRLIGSVVLVLVGVVGFPLVFDTQPRPMPVDVQIEIPDKAKVTPLQMSTSATDVVVSEAPALVPNRPAKVGVSPAATSSPPATAPARAVTKPVDTKVSAAASLDDEEQLVAPDSAKNMAKQQTVRATVATHNEAKTDDGARAKALLDSKLPAKPKEVKEAKDSKDTKEAKDDDNSRYIIQVGAFADTAKAQEARLKLEHAGLKTYTHVAETKDGPRTRVRLGPFTSKAEAEKAANKVKALALPAAILTL